MILHSVILLSALACASNGDTITPHKTEEFVAKGSDVTLSCSYSSAWSLLWYRQYPGSAPEYLVLISDGVKHVQTSDVDQRFSTNIRKEKQNHVDLEISSASISDSALYYCALTPTVTGNTRTLYKNLTVKGNNGVSFGDEITADSTEESAAVGSTVTLSCSYSSANTLQWYRQYPGSAPQFRVLIIESVKETMTSAVDPRISTKLKKEKQATKEIKHVDLIISSAAVSDSALYYCALRPTVTGNTSALYKNYPGSAPEFIVFILESAKQAEESNVDSRFTAKVSKDKENHVDLEISSASISDSALYYCALEPTYPGSAPQFIVLITDGSKQAEESNVDARFTAKVTKDKEKHVDLEISSASISDSALYYCALQPTVTGNT
ncbi:hypothetical protein G5714_002026 [Onychostoma macrolepis]|uniref:Ig-like domain-containing protein n=1 Tax=Onychostoma macrolepis TaxID=369639 RepID=A0A7J6DDU0_9TELE|nr:hypothetical protein G5714_002026 [Onychostoma macrolepis]